jgi:isoleucyl-tRNA synthetase
MIEFNEAADKMGADTMRWLYASCKPEQNLRFGYHNGDETRRRFMIPLWNVYSFLVTYANLDGWRPDVHDRSETDNPANAQLDQWIVERLKETTLAMRRHLDGFDSQRATFSAESFLEDLSNWYVRRSRRRFWRGEMDVDKQAAYETLYFVLLQFTKLVAPFIPFTAEAIYQNLAFGDGHADDLTAAMLPKSVHHTLYPKYSAETLDQALLDKMALAITAASLGRAARGSADIKLRQPLAKVRINVGSEQQRADLMELTDVLQEEINVKAIEVVSEVGELVDYKILPNNRTLGPKFGKQFPAVRKALTALDAAAVARALQDDGTVSLQVGGETVVLTADDVLVQTEAKGELAVASDKGVTVAVDTHLTPELVQEGYARDLVRMLNNARKDAGFEISDRVRVTYSAEGDVADALVNFGELIRSETLAESLEPGSEGDFSTEVTVGDSAVTLNLSKV